MRPADVLEISNADSAAALNGQEATQIHARTPAGALVSGRGQLLRLLRAGHGWTQQEAAERAGFSDRLIRKAESGGPLQTQSIAVLAELYSTSQRRLTPGDLLLRPPRSR